MCRRCSGGLKADLWGRWDGGVVIKSACLGCSLIRLVKEGRMKGAGWWNVRGWDLGQ